MYVELISGGQERPSPLILGTSFHEVTLNISSTTFHGSYSVKNIDFSTLIGSSAGSEEEVKSNVSNGTFSNNASSKQFDVMPGR